MKRFPWLNKSGFILVAGLILAGCSSAKEPAPASSAGDSLILKPGPTSIDIALKSELELAPEQAKLIEAAEETPVLVPEPEPKQAAETISPPQAPPLEAAYKTDAGYLALDRFERPHRVRPVKDGGKPGIELARDFGETLQIVDKPLILGGKGFDIEDFGREEEYQLHFVFEKHLEEAMPPEIERKQPEQMDPDMEETRSRKYLIFHPGGPILGGMPEAEGESAPEKTVREARTEMKPNPDTVVLLNQKKATLLQLAPAKNPLNLLTEHQAILKHEFKMLQSDGP